MPKKELKIMNEEIKKYKVLMLNAYGQLVPAFWIKSTQDYDHSQCELHHFIPFAAYVRDKEWYKSRGIEQKLILMRKHTHEQLHFQAIKNMTDEDFKSSYNISRWDLVFSRKQTERK